jgi:hypothetical protein
MPKNKVRKKNGKKVKYTPKPKGLSKTKMKKLMEMIAQQQKELEAQNKAEPRDEKKPIEISEEFTKKMNVISSEAISVQGPSLSSSNT